MLIPMRSLAFAAWFMLVAAAVIQAAQAAEPAAASDIRFSFKLDPRLAGGTYGGERWVSGPAYTGIGGQNTVEVRAKVLDAAGRPLNISPKWVPDDPAMLSVSPGDGQQVTITVQRAGESRLKVTSQGVTKELSVTAAVRNDVLQVQIAQPGVVRPRAARDVPAPDPVAAPPQNAPALNGEKEKVGYALGMKFGSAIRKSSLEVDQDLLIKGLQDALSSNQTLLTETEMRAILLASQAARLDELAEKNKENGAAFLAENKAKEGVVTLESGLQYKVLKAADGRKPAAGDTVVTHYRGTFIDGTEFDSSYRRNQPATVSLPKAIKGWRQALQLMPVGSKWQLFIPSDLAYGDGMPKRKAGRNAPKAAKGARVAPPNATLIYDVELISIRDKLGAKQASAQ
jgi:FKBP-type peptidyl-prolyl cis-trans isomerase FklB